jgi:hypothetical protein
MGESFFLDVCSEVYNLAGWYYANNCEFHLDYVMWKCRAYIKYYYPFIGIEVFSYFDWNFVDFYLIWLVKYFFDQFDTG